MPTAPPPYTISPPEPAARRGAGIGLLLAAVLAMGLAVPGCAEAPEAGHDGRTPVRLFILLISARQVAYYQWAEQAFEAAHPDVDIIIEQFPGSSLKDFEIKLRLRFASGQAPDAFHAHESVVAELAHLGLLAPAPDYIRTMAQQNGLNEMVRNAACHSGGCYGIVSDAVWTALYYNKAFFREAGLDPDRPPRTWDELIDYADRLTVRRADGTPVRAGLSLRKSGYKPGTAEKWLTFLYAAGGRPFNDDGTRSAFNSAAGRAALDLYKTILFDRRIDAVTLEGDQQGFGQERVAMFIREVHVIRWLQENYPSLDFGVAPIPAKARSVSAGATYQFVVSRDSPHADAAWRFVAFLMSDEGYGRYAAIGGILPATQSVAARPPFRDDPHLQVFLDQPVALANPFPRVGRALDILGAYIERFCYGHLTAEETLTRAARDIDALLARNPRRPSPPAEPTR